MTVIEMKNYLAMIINLEREESTQNQAIYNLNNQIYWLGKYREIGEPQKPLDTVNTRGVDADAKGRLLAIAGALAAVFGFFITSGFFLISGVLVLLVGGGYCFFGRVVFDEDYREAVKRYNQKVEQYKKSLVEDAKRVDAERVKKTALQSSLNVLKSANKKTANCLQQLYNKNIIYPKYRNLACVCTLYEYFDSGRCTTLEGHEGAYNLLENEMRLNRIITQNNRILENLEAIRENQELLYDSIQAANQKADQIISGCNRMSNQLNGIQAQGAELNARVAQLQTTSDLNLYVNTCAKRELEYMNRANRIF